MDLTIKAKIPGAYQYVLIHMDLIKWFNISIISKNMHFLKTNELFPLQFWHNKKKTQKILLHR